MLLIGSRSLCNFLSLGRDPDDWDIKVTNQELDELEKRYPLALRAMKGPGKYSLRVNNEFIEIGTCSNENTNKQLIDYAESHNLPMIRTPIGMAREASVGIHYILKKAGKFKLGKNLRDLAKIEEYMRKYHIELDEELKLLMEDNMKKTAFFDKYKLTRYVDHDTLHEWVAKGVPCIKDDTPTYKRILVDPVSPSNGLFICLQEPDKDSILAEEALVLGLERWFLFHAGQGRHPQELLERFGRYNKSSDPTIYWLDKLCGSLKDHPKFLADYCRDNYDRIKIRVGGYVRTIKLPTEFWHLVYGVYFGEKKPIGEEYESNG